MKTMSKCALPGIQRISPLRRLLRSWQLYVLLAPTLIYLFLFNYVPMYGLQIAFRDFAIKKGISGSPWVGWKHFLFFFNCSGANYLSPLRSLIEIFVTQNFE